jgi:hypothetical protein
MSTFEMHLPTPKVMFIRQFDKFLYSVFNSPDFLKIVSYRSDFSLTSQILPILEWICPSI